MAWSPHSRTPTSRQGFSVLTEFGYRANRIVLATFPKHYSRQPGANSKGMSSSAAHRHLDFRLIEIENSISNRPP